MANYIWNNISSSVNPTRKSKGKSYEPSMLSKLFKRKTFSFSILPWENLRKEQEEEIEMKKFLPRHFQVERYEIMICSKEYRNFFFIHYFSTWKISYFL